MNKKSINKAKQIRRTRKKGCRPFLRSVGVKRRHAYYYSYQKNMDQQKYYMEEIQTDEYTKKYSKKNHKSSYSK